MTHLTQFESTGTGLLVRAPAKINLSLLITGKRPDGYHGIETLMAKIDWYDELRFEPSGSGQFELVCTGPHWAPDGPKNLVWRACEMLMAKAGQTIPLRVTLTKNIPAGTGLGSASSDAAAALMGLNRFAGLHMPDDALHEIAASLGSDINFFLGGPLAYCTGRGEKLQKIDVPFEFSALLLTPNISIATKRVYENYAHDPTVYQAFAEKINPLLAKKNIDSVAKICANMLELSCFQLENRLLTLKTLCERLCDSKICLSGSGSAMYMLVPTLNETVLRLQETLKTEFDCVSRFINNNRW